jgi:signal transduction histidine kinase
MTQTKVTQGQNNQTELGDILQLIAANPSSKAILSPVLQSLQIAASASGITLVLFDNPQLFITIGEAEDWTKRLDTLKSIVLTLPDTVSAQVSLPKGFRPRHKGWVIAPLRHQDVLQGAIWLSFNSADDFNPDIEIAIAPLLAKLKILIANLQSQDMYERSEQLTLSLLNSITDPLLVLDVNRHLILMNPAAEGVFKTTLSEMRGKTLNDVTRSDELTAFAEEGKVLTEWITSDEKTFIPRIEEVHDPAGSVKGWVMALRDVTHFKKLNRNQSEFMRIVSHDLRSPLTSMQGFASMLELGLVGDLNEKQKHFVSKILAGITQMTALVDNIQDAGRYDPETGFYDLTRSHVDLGEMAHRIVENHLVPAEKALNISVSVAEDVPIINADANMLERAIINLFDNAIKYTPDGGKIEVDVKRLKNDVLVSVHDTGLGISKEAQQRLFERHVRIPREEHKKIKGSGLGLFIVRSVAQRHGGDAWVESKEGEGSTFYLGIPLDGPNLVAAKG